MRIRMFLTTLVLLCFSWLSLARSTDISSRDLHLVQSIESGASALHIRLDMIERAKKSIDLEYFIYNDDEAGRILTEALIHKKAKNPEIKIRMLLDYFALSKSLNPFYAHQLIDKGIEFKYYNPAFILRLHKVAHRNHRKIFLIDEEEVIVGGRNIANEYFDFRPKFNFSDRDIWVKGPIVSSVKESFDHFWDSHRSVVPHKPKEPILNPDTGHDTAYEDYIRKLEAAKRFTTILDPSILEDKVLLDWKNKSQAIGRRHLKEEPIFKVRDIRFISDGPDWKVQSHRQSGKVYYELLENAQSRIFIETPYLYLQKAEEMVFERLKNNSVEVNVLINSKKASHEFAINYITLLEGMKLAKKGFQVFLNQGNLMQAEDLIFPKYADEALWVLHAKTLLLDDRLTWIGSLNMDPRSVQRFNSELAFLIDDEAFYDRLLHHYLNRLRSSKWIDSDGRTIDGEDPSKIENVRELLKQFTTYPLYMFEDQI